MRRVLRLPAEWDIPVEQYTHLGVTGDGRYCGVHRLMYHWTLHVDVHERGYEDRYCFATQELAVAALDNWDGIGDPEGWHRHPNTMRRRNIETGEEWTAP